jgi:hypothetical protein
MIDINLAISLPPPSHALLAIMTSSCFVWALLEIVTSPTLPALLSILNVVIPILMSALWVKNLKLKCSFRP